MLKIITSLLVFLIGIAAQAQTEDSKLAAVTKIKVKNGVELVYTENTTPMLKVEAQNAKSLQKVVTSIKGNTLTVSARNTKPGTIKVLVSTPKIESFKAASGAKITLESPVTAPSLQVILNSGARFSGVTRTETMKLYANYGTIYNGRAETGHFFGNFSNAKVNLSGTARYASIRANQATYVYAKNFICDDSNVNAANDSSIVMNGHKHLRFTTDESVQVTYYGCPETVEVNNQPIASN